MKNRPDLERNQKTVDAAMGPDGGNGYTYTTSDSKQYKKQKRKEGTNKVQVSKTKLKKEFKKQYKGNTSAWIPSSATKRKTKMVSKKRAKRMEKRGWKEDIYM